MIHTADITHKELQAARKAAGLYQYQVAALLHVSEDTLSRWETGEVIPSPDQVDEMEKIYKAPGLWYGWMRWRYKSFRDRYPDSESSEALTIAIVNAGYQMGDVMRQQDAVVRDALDGRIDNLRGFEEYIKQAREAHEALGAMLAQYEGGNANVCNLQR